MSSSRNYQSPKSSNSGPSFLKIRSPFASLFSFRKSKHEVNLSTQHERSNIFSVFNQPAPNTEPVKKKFEIYQSARSVKQIASFFESYQKKPSQNIPSDAQLQREAFQVLGDLDHKLAQEQSYSHTLRTCISPTYEYGSIHSKESSYHSTADQRREYSTLSSHNGRRVSLEEAHSTHATYRPKRFYEMYSVRHNSASKSETYSKNIYAKSPSMCSDSSRNPNFAPISGKFSSSSLNLPSESLEYERVRQNKSRRIPVTSINWNKSSFSQPEVSRKPFRAQSALDLTNAGNTSQTNRIFDLYKYRNSSRVPASGSKVSYQNDLTSRMSQNSSSKFSTGYYKTGSCRPPGSHWEEENKENSFELNHVANQPSSCAETKTERDTEVLEVLNEFPVLEHVYNLQDQAQNFIVPNNQSHPNTLTLQTEDNANSDVLSIDTGLCEDNLNVSHTNVPVDFPMTIEIENKMEEPVTSSPSSLSEPEPMEVDFPKVSLPSTGKIPSTATDLQILGNSEQKDTSLQSLQKRSFFTGPLFTKQDRTTFVFPSCKQSVEPSTSNKDYSPSTHVFKSSKPISEIDTASKNASTDIAERPVMLNTRLDLRDNNLGYRSDMLKHQKRNASSLPDLIDEKNYLCDYIDDHCAKAHKMFSGNNFNTGNITTWREDPNSVTFDSSEKLKTCSFDPAHKRTSNEKDQNTSLLEKFSNSTNTVAKADGTKEGLHLPETVPPYSDIHKKYKSMYFNRANYVQHGDDTNNNRPFSMTKQTRQEIGEAEGLNNIFIDPKIDSDNTEKVKTPEYGMSQLYTDGEKDVSIANQQSVDRGMQDVETTKEMAQCVSIHFNQAPNKITEFNEQPRFQRITIIPTSQIEEDHLHERPCTKDNTELKSLNLLKEHLLLAPEPYKRSVHPKEDTNPPISGCRLTPDIYTCENVPDIKASEIQQKSETYTCQGVTEKTQIYETCYTDSSKPDVDTIEYHKVVSIYYTLPRKYSKTLLNVSQNNLKNIDQTLENNSAPSTLLGNILNKCPTAEENHEFSNQNMVKTSLSQITPENKELDLGKKSLRQEHLFNFNLIPLQTNLVNRNTEPLPGAETSSDVGLTDPFDLVDRFSNLHITSSDSHPKGIETQRNIKNKNECSPTRTSPQYTQNPYYTLPNRKSNFQDLERTILENDIAMARNRHNLYSKRGNSFPTTPESKDVFLSPTFEYANLNFTEGYNSPNFQEKQADTHNFVKKDNGLGKKDSFDDVIYREDIPSLYKSKSLKNLKRQDSFYSRDPSPGMETKLSPQFHSQSYIAKANEPLNLTRPSYNSAFVQKKMKPINAKKFTFTFDNTGQREHSNSRSSESFGDSLRQSDVDSPCVFYSPKDNYPLHVKRHNHGQGSRAESRSYQPFNMYRSKSLKTLSHDYEEEEEVAIRRKSDGNFSSKSYGGNMKGRSFRTDSTHNRRHSTEMIDENDNWPQGTDSGQTPVYTSKTVDYGIFGKDQQEELLNNVKRSLTEGRLWRPSFLKNPSSLRNEEPSTSQESQKTACKPDGLKGTLNIYEEEVLPNSDSDSDTTMEDEYYLDDIESEL
ncbi:exophilin-5 isoform X2 [Pyxicephalus adspersus]